ncbi:MAG TPA: uroporphyrinogen-III synthase [Tahibacter sp.]|nr:uroporphyrinogen-III synthase [Tahibacter sp.]
MLKRMYYGAMSAPLRGATVIVTRPAGTGAALARRIRALGGEPLTLPGLALRATDDATAARRALAAARRADVVVFISPAAVRYAWRLAPTLAFARRTRVCTVGAATAQALRRRGIADVLTPDSTQDADGLLAMAPLARLRGLTVALIGAPGGRDTLPNALRRRGATLVRADVYYRTAPRWTRRHYAALETAPKPRLLLISSAEALAHLATRLPAGLVLALRDAETIVSSERLAGLAREHGFTRVHRARSALAGDMLAAAAAALGRHRL